VSARFVPACEDHSAFPLEEGLQLAHEQDEDTSSDGTDVPPRSRRDGSSATSDAEPRADASDQRSRDGAERGSDDPEIAQVERDLANAEEALEGEIVVEPPSARKQRRAHWNAPLPRPADLAAYNDIDPTFAERIVRAYERQIEIAERREDSINSAVEAQVEIQTELARADIRLTSRGQWMLYSIAVVSLIGAGVFVFAGMPVPAVVSVILGVLSLSVNLVTTVSSVVRPKEVSDEPDETADG